MPLLAVELGYGGHFALEEGRDAEIVVRVQAGDVLWQKERLLNIGVAALPAACDAVAWVDCDVIFGTADWAERVRATLERADLVHLFHDRYDLPRDTPMERLERHGLYDACILGGADRVMLATVLGRFDVAVGAGQMNSRRVEHYLAWARPYFASTAGRVGSVPGHAFHLWHGELKDRRYDTRMAHLADFDPFTDIALSADGCWRWSSDRPELHESVGRYFDERDEDGAALGVVEMSEAASHRR